MPKHKVIWTQDLVDIIIKRVGEGIPARNIAEALGDPFTKNMILGKIFRLGLSKPAKGRTPKPRTRKRRSPTFREWTPVVRDETIPFNYTLTTLPINGCHYPHGCMTYTFCGNPVIDNSCYCAYHYAVCYRPAHYKQRLATPLGAVGSPSLPPPIEGEPLSP
jgi:hypothetical protein